VKNSIHQETSSDLYVSPDGDGSNDGLSPATALRSIGTAVYRIASHSADPWTLHLLPGVYSTTANDQVYPIALKSLVRVKGTGADVTLDPSKSARLRGRVAFPQRPKREVDSVFISKTLY